MTEPFGQTLFQGGYFSMNDTPNVAEPGAATVSRAMTAPASAGFPTPANPSHGALAHSPAGGAAVAKPAPAKRSGLRRFVVPVIILAALGYGGKTAYDYFVEGRFLVSTDDAYVGALTSIIAAKATGHITAVPVVQNQVVHKGDLIVAIDDGDYQNAVDRPGPASAPRTRRSRGSPARSTPRQRSSPRPQPRRRRRAPR